MVGIPPFRGGWVYLQNGTHMKGNWRSKAPVRTSSRLPKRVQKHKPTGCKPEIFVNFQLLATFPKVLSVYLYEMHVATILSSGMQHAEQRRNILCLNSTTLSRMFSRSILHQSSPVQF